MKPSLRVVASMIAAVLTLSACANTRPTYYESYPAYSGGYGYGPSYGYEPYAFAPYDPYGGYYQSYYQATPYYYEPPYSDRDHPCEDRPCGPYKRPQTKHEEPAAEARPPERTAFSRPSTISRSPGDRRSGRRASRGHKHRVLDSSH
jgi:hypothetical protein